MTQVFNTLDSVVFKMVPWLIVMTAVNGYGLNSRYVTFSESSVRKCTISQIKRPEINICLDGQATPADLERAKNWAARASLTWLRVLKTIDEGVTKQIVFSCQNKHLSIHLRPGGGTSHATPSAATIFLTRPYGTWTHELGHALAGLGDTYQSGAGKCGSQPESLMCWGAYGPRANPEEWSTLWPDDIKGIQANYHKIFPGNPNAPTWADDIDLEDSLNSDEPWPDFNFVGAKVKNHKVKIIKGPASVIDTSEDTDSIDL